MSTIILFEEKQVRRAWNQAEGKWYFAIADVVAVLTGSVNPGAYWRKLKERLKKEGNQTVTNCHGLKMTAGDGRQRLTDVADTEQLLRLIQSIPSPKAEPFKLWLARVGFERLEEIENPELAAQRMREIYRQKGYSADWIERRMRGIAVRDELTDEWKKRGVLDADRARIYGVPTKRLNEQVKRNARRFPKDFVFQLTREEARTVSLRSQVATLNKGLHIKHLPYAFTEHGAIQASSNPFFGPLQIPLEFITPIRAINAAFDALLLEFRTTQTQESGRLARRQATARVVVEDHRRRHRMLQRAALAFDESNHFFWQGYGNGHDGWHRVGAILLNRRIVVQLTRQFSLVKRTPHLPFLQQSFKIPPVQPDKLHCFPDGQSTARVKHHRQIPFQLHAQFLGRQMHPGQGRIGNFNRERHMGIDNEHRTGGKASIYYHQAP